MQNPVWTLAGYGQLAITLEASAPKPGNVNRLKRFSDTGYRHFLASAALVSRGYYLAALRGKQIADGLIEPKDVKIGSIIRECISDVFTNINRSNAIFGTILLHIPLIISASAMIGSDADFSISRFEEYMKRIIDAGSVEDSIDLYHAFRIASPRGDLDNLSDLWKEKHDRYDISNPKVFDNIKEDNMTLPKLFRIASDVDDISNEWITYYHQTFHETLPYLDKLSDSLENLEEAIVRTFVWRLSQHPDGLIVKKAGTKAAARVMNIARSIIDAKEESLSEMELLDKLDSDLRQNGNLLNPGTTADLVSAAIFCKLVKEDISKTKG
jgi:triphosphoribosyl-dephospho-CoA synthase